MKQGLTNHLAVEFDIPLDSISKVEFAFANKHEPKPIKKETWPGQVSRHPEKNILLVPFTASETFNFDEDIYMDTRITLIDSLDQPITQIVSLKMDKTLFEKE